jgi:hypothetical protein
VDPDGETCSGTVRAGAAARTDVVEAAAVGGTFAAGFSNLGAQPGAPPSGQQSIAGAEKAAADSSAGRVQQKSGSAMRPPARTRSARARPVLFMFFESNLRARQAHSVMQMHPLRGPYGSTASRTPRLRPPFGSRSPSPSVHAAK